MSRVRPNRSDAHVSFEEERKIEDETRQHFDDIAPKRHSKPQRSDHSSQYTDSFSNSDASSDINPELVKFQNLENQDPQEKLSYNGSEPNDEYVETEYYKDLNCVDKQHHTTGTGFIEMKNVDSNYFKLEPDSDTDIHSSSKGNPATNEWIPSPADDTVISTSSKPSRSENK